MCGREKMNYVYDVHWHVQMLNAGMTYRVHEDLRATGVACGGCVNRGCTCAHGMHTRTQVSGSKHKQGWPAAQREERDSILRVP